MGSLDSYEFQVADRVLITTTGVKAAHAAGMYPYILREVAVLVTTTLAADAAVIQIRRTPSGGSVAVVATINLAASLAVGKVVFKDGLSQKFSPGDLLDVNVSDLSTTGNVSVVVKIEPSYEVPKNNANMAATT